MTTGFLLLSFERVFVLMGVEAGMLAMEEGVGQSVHSVYLAPALAVLTIPGRQRVEVSLFVSLPRLQAPAQSLGLMLSLPTL